MKHKTLSFTQGNSKLGSHISVFSLPAGHSCPFAKDCMSKADKNNGKIIDGKHCQFRCYAATAEARFSSVRKSRWTNFELLKQAKTITKMATLIGESLPKNAPFVRIHASGDFFNETYFLAWLNVAKNYPMTIFYAYTKALPFVVKYKKYIPHNLRITASKGGTHDNLISKHHLKYAQVVYSVNEAIQKGLEIDHDDSHAISANKSFALLLHGSQPGNSKAAAALSQLKKQGYTGYNDKNGAMGFGENTKQKMKIFVHVNKFNRINFFPKGIDITV